jgi:SAM-dependent methyltransferase
LQVAAPKSFAHIRSFLKDAGFTEQVVCERLGVASQHELLLRRPSDGLRDAEDAVALLAHLFLVGSFADEGLISKLIPGVVREALAETGLLRHHSCGSVYAPASLYPIGEIYIASDRWSNPDGSHFTPDADIVYPAITKNTYRFMGLLPRSRCERLLDLCSGSGVAALDAAAHYAGQAWAADVTARSTDFTRFNIALNGLDNATAAQGDLYGPFQNLAFDRIVAHPPYVPATSQRWIFQDGGAVGEEITRRIVAGLERYLSPGGGFYCLSLGMDRQGEPLEQRIRGWLGETEADFDVLLAAVDTHSPEQIASQQLLRGEIPHAEFMRRKTAFQEAGAERFVYGFTIVRRHEGRRAAFTIRRQLGPRSGSAELEWAMRWESAAAVSAGVAAPLESRPVAAKGLELLVLHKYEQSTLTPSEFTFQVSYPFSMECRVQAWTAALMELCDGSRTVSELHAQCVGRRWIPAQVPVAEFAGLLGTLVSGGILEIDGFRLPAAMASS